MMRNKSKMLMRKKVAGFVLSAVLVFGLCVGFSVNVLAAHYSATGSIAAVIKKPYNGKLDGENADATAAIPDAQAQLKTENLDGSGAAAELYIFKSLTYAAKDVKADIEVTMIFTKGDDTFEIVSTGGEITQKVLSSPEATFSAVLADPAATPVLVGTGFADAISSDDVTIDVISSLDFEYVNDNAGTPPTVVPASSGTDIDLAGADAGNYTTLATWGDIDVNGGELVDPVAISVSPASVTVKASAAKANAVLTPVATVTDGDPSAYILTTNNSKFVVGTNKELKVGAAALTVGTYKVNMIVNDGISPGATSAEITVTVVADPAAGQGGGPVAPTADDKVTGQINVGNEPAITLTTNGTLAALSGKTLNTIAEGGGSLAINQGIYTINLSPELIGSLDLSGTDKVDITMKKTAEDGTDLSIGTDGANGSLLLFTVDVTLSVNGTEVKNFPHPITFSVDISSFDLTDEQKANLTGIRILLNGEIVQLGGYVDGDNFIFSTMQLSKYGVAVSDNIIKIAAAINSRTYTINGEQMTTDAAPMMVDDGTIMVPVRFIAEAFGADVSWADETKTVGISLDGKNLSMVVGQKADGMDVAPTIINGRTMVPLRYISEKLGTNVIWDDAARSIDITR